MVGRIEGGESDWERETSGQNPVATTDDVPCDGDFVRPDEGVHRLVDLLELEDVARSEITEHFLEELRRKVQQRGRRLSCCGSFSLFLLKSFLRSFGFLRSQGQVDGRIHQRFVLVYRFRLSRRCSRSCRNEAELLCHVHVPFRFFALGLRCCAAHFATHFSVHFGSQKSADQLRLTGPSIPSAHVLGMWFSNLDADPLNSGLAAPLILGNCQTHARRQSRDVAGDQSHESEIKLPHADTVRSNSPPFPARFCLRPSPTPVATTAYHTSSFGNSYAPRSLVQQPSRRRWQQNRTSA